MNLIEKIGSAGKAATVGAGIALVGLGIGCATTPDVSRMKNNSRLFACNYYVDRDGNGASYYDGTINDEFINKGNIFGTNEMITIVVQSSVRSDHWIRTLISKNGVIVTHKNGWKDMIPASSNGRTINYIMEPGEFSEGVYKIVSTIGRNTWSYELENHLNIVSDEELVRFGRAIDDNRYDRSQDRVAQQPIQGIAQQDPHYGFRRGDVIRGIGKAMQSHSKNPSESAKWLRTLEGGADIEDAINPK